MRFLRYRRCEDLGRVLSLLAVAFGLGQMLGCEVNSYLDPSKTGRFEFTATSIPILQRIDAIEEGDDHWAQATSVTPEDLIPNDLSYRIAPGDVITVEIFEMYAAGVWSTSTRRIDAGGNFRLPELGDVGGAGLTAQQFEDRVIALLEQQVMPEPLVNVVVEEGSGFRYTVYGAIQPGLFTLRSPDLRLLDALAVSGGVPLATRKIYVIRQIILTDEIEPSFDRDSTPSRTPVPPPPTDEPVIDVEDLIDQLDDSPPRQPDVSPGMLQSDEPVIDIDDLEPPSITEQPAIDVDQLTGDGRIEPGRPSDTDSFIFVPERNEWVRVRGTGTGPSGLTLPEGIGQAPEMILERIIEIPYQRLSKGDSSYNIVIRPDDRIYVDAAEQGVVYIDGEILRPGVYQMPVGGKLTLSRLVAAAGGFSAIAIPERVDLTRMVGIDREATVRLNLAAIRNRTEPDIFVKPNDHVIIGTNFWALPLAVIRNGFRATYGFGFLLDRNFGNDVFGAPPSNDNRF